MVLAFLAWFITLEIDLHNYGIIYQESLAESTKRPWLGALALGWALSPSGARLLANQALRGLRIFSDEFHSVRGNAKIVVVAIFD